MSGSSHEWSHSQVCVFKSSIDSKFDLSMMPRVLPAGVLENLFK